MPPSGIRRPPTQVKINVKLHSESSKGVSVTKTKTVSVAKPKNEAQLAKSFQKVLNAVDKTSFDQKDMAKELARAALSGGTVHLSTAKGTPISKVNVSAGDTKGGIARVVHAMEKHMGYEVVDENDLAKQLAKLAESAKANK